MQILINFSAGQPLKCLFQMVVMVEQLSKNVKNMYQNAE